MATKRKANLLEVGSEDYEPNKKIKIHNSYRNGGYVYTRPLTSTTMHGPWYFELSSASNVYTDPRTLQLLGAISVYEINDSGGRTHVDAVSPVVTKLATEAGEPEQFSTTDNPLTKLSVINNLPHSAIDTIRVRIGDNNSISVHEFYWLRSYIETLLSTSKNTKDFTLHARGFFMEPGNHMQSRTTDNPGFDHRQKTFLDGQRVDFIIPLHIDLATLQGHLKPGLSIKLEIERKSSEFCFLEDSNVSAEIKKRKFEVVFEDLQLRAMQYTLIKGLEDKVNELGQEWNTPFTRVEIRDFTVLNGETQIIKPNFWNGNGQLPEQVIIVMTEEDSIGDKRDKNPFQLEDRNIRNAYLTKLGPDGKDIPFTPVDIDGKFGQIVAYDEFLKAIGISEWEDTDIGITKEDYFKGYFMMAWDLTKDRCARAHFHTPEYGQMGLRIQLGAGGTNKTYHVFVYSVYNEILNIDRENNVSNALYTKELDLNNITTTSTS